MFKGTVFFSGANKSLQTDNSADAKAAGLAAPDALNKVWDVNIAEGGPIKKDKLWFFASYRDWGVYQYIANSFFANGDQTVDDAQHSQRRGSPDDHASTRSTRWRRIWIASASSADTRTRRRPATPSPEKRPTFARRSRYYTTEGKYTGTLTSRLLARGRLRHQQRKLFADACRMHSLRRSIPRRDTTLADRVQRVRRRHLLPRADPAHRRDVGVVRHRIARLQGRVPVRMGLLLAAASRGGRSDSAL